MAEAVIADRGVIVVEFFDLGYSRWVPWERRSEAVALLEQERLADHRFDAVVVGEFGRAFTDRHDLERNRRRSGAPLPRSSTRRQRAPGG
jgi:hypothetical protein